MDDEVMDLVSYRLLNKRAALKDICDGVLAADFITIVDISTDTVSHLWDYKIDEIPKLIDTLDIIFIEVIL